MNTDSIEYKTENIYHSKTREYFNEVLSSYHQGNYRSAIVMLYSVVICDLVYKLKELEDKYGDNRAQDILNEIKKQQTENPTSSEWEQELIEQVKNRTNLLDSQDSNNIDYLRKQRHLSAHPVLNQLDILIRPNKETVRANIVNMLDGLLCKPPLLSNHLISTFLIDLISIKDQIINHNDLSKYLNSKYFNNINRPTQEKLFRDLWKFVFRLDDEKSKENRNINFKAFIFLYKKDPISFDKLIESDKEYYSHINLDNKDILNLALQLFSAYPNTYIHINKATKIMVKSISSDDYWFPKTVFLSESFEVHINSIRTKIILDDSRSLKSLNSSDRWLLFNLSKEYGQENTYLNLLIDLFAESSDFNDADYNFQYYILAYRDLFTKNQYIRILENINSNHQIYGRDRSIEDNLLLKTAIENKFNNEINFDGYSNFDT